MHAAIDTLFESDFYRILNFKCRCTDCHTSKPEYSDAFSISFIRKGNFIFNVFRHALDCYIGGILVTKPYYERTVTHAHAVPDECTIFEFRQSFYPVLLERYGHKGFFEDNDIHSTLIRSCVEAEFIHYHIFQLLAGRISFDKLQLDELVVEMMAYVFERAAVYLPDERINQRLKRHHLSTIEKAKYFIADNFTEDISLKQIADHCNVSIFHFSRLFKLFTTLSPHQFLLALRLQHARQLLRKTELPVAGVAFSSGFNNVEHFTAAFSKAYSVPPGRFRGSLPGRQF